MQIDGELVHALKLTHRHWSVVCLCDVSYAVVCCIHHHSHPQAGLVSSFWPRQPHTGSSAYHFPQLLPVCLRGRDVEPPNFSFWWLLASCVQIAANSFRSHSGSKKPHQKSTLKLGFMLPARQCNTALSEGFKWLTKHCMQCKNTE